MLIQEIGLGGTDSNFNYQLDVDTNGEYDRAVVLQCSIPTKSYLFNGIDQSGYIILFNYKKGYQQQ